MATLTGKLRYAYLWFAHSAEIQSVFLLAVRLYWGWLFFQTGWGKLHNLPHVVEFFSSLGIPAPVLNAYFVSSLECVGGALLFIGLGGRIAALGLSFDMLVAFLTADRESLKAIFSSDPSKFYESDPFSFLFASLVILFFGAGIFSLDHMIERFRRKRGNHHFEPRAVRAS